MYHIWFTCWPHLKPNWRYIRDSFSRWVYASKYCVFDENDCDLTCKEQLKADTDLIQTHVSNTLNLPTPQDL